MADHCPTCTALLHYSGSFYGAAIASGMKASGAADAVAHIERAARGLHSLAHPPRSPAYHLEDDVLHRDDVAVNAFARAMKAKLAQKRAQGRGGWDGPDCNAEMLSRLLREHVEKGDPLDVGNLAMMLHQRGERITPPEDVGALREALTEMVGAVCGDTGFAACVRRDSGRAYPWEALEIAEAKARAALAKQGGSDNG